MNLNPRMFALSLDSNHRTVPEFLVVYPPAQCDISGCRRRGGVRFGVICC